MNTDKGQIKAVDIVTGDISDDLKKQMRAKVPDDPTKTMSLIYSLVQRATTAKCDLTTNNDVTDGLTSGAECIIESIGNSSRPSITWVSFSDPSIGSQENCHLYHKGNMKKNWTPILEVTRQFRINKKSQVKIIKTSWCKNYSSFSR